MRFLRTEYPRVLAGHSDHFCVLDYRAFLKMTKRAQELAHKPHDLLNKLYSPAPGLSVATSAKKIAT